MPLTTDRDPAGQVTPCRSIPPSPAAAEPRSHAVAEKPLPPSIPRDDTSSREGQIQRLRLLAAQGIAFEYLTGRTHIEDPALFEGSIENFVGLAQVPVGIVGPLRVNGTHARGDFYVPMATTEGALVASYNRGAKLISLGGGATTICLAERVSRAPGFEFRRVTEAARFTAWTATRLEAFRNIVETTTRHGRLEDLRPILVGSQVYLNFGYTTGDAAGQNTVTIATEAICQYILARSPIQPRYWFVESNMSGDKKATAMSFQSVRGKNVTAEVVIPRELFVRTFQATPEMMVEYWKMSVVAGIQTGSIGAQGHYANALAAIFIACGQDVACVSEASVGLTRLDLVEKGSLYASVSLPNLIVGTVGGGTRLPTQRECLQMMGCTGDATAKKFAEICAASVLAGEISIVGALVAGHFTQAHTRFGRKKTA